MKGLDVQGVLGPTGALSRALPGYEHRPEQLRLAEEVEQAFARRAYLMAEAGTGTGKTLAYLVPAVLSGRKVVVSTATKTLQEQIFLKDIPLLQKKVGLSFAAAYLKGRSNYLCLHRLESFSQSPQFATREEAERWDSLQDWAKTTQTGDRAELDLPDSYATWSQLSTTSDTCLGQKCPVYDNCFVTRMRRRAEEADVVVVNHHLFFADLSIQSRTGGGRQGEGVLPRYDAVVFDEAHALEDVATEYFGRQVSSWRVEELCADAQRALPQEDGRVGMLSALALKLRGDAETFFRAAPRALGLLGGEPSTRLSSKSFSSVRNQVTAVIESLAALASMTVSADEPELAALCRRASEIGEELDFIQRADSSDHVYWAEARGRGTFLRAAPIDVAAELQKRLYGSVDTLVFTSATLAAGGRFDFFARRLGLEDSQALGSEVRQLSVESPFDYPRQAALYTPGHLPEPNAPGFLEALAEELVQLTYLTDGRCFALFTSLRNMEAVHQLTRNRLPYQILLQGERPKTALLEAFRAEPSVLFASHSFWEGVDVPGDALSLVVIDRLPFASPGDPLVSARIDQLRERGEEPFSAYQLPEAILALRQGFGRLIRTQKDRGIVAVLDRRITSKAYGRSFLASLPKAKRFAQLESLRQWYGETDAA
jgi:ATP-dependent DNA helicase DinG